MHMYVNLRLHLIQRPISCFACNHGNEIKMFCNTIHTTSFSGTFLHVRTCANFSGLISSYDYICYFNNSL